MTTKSNTIQPDRDINETNSPLKKQKVDKQSFITAVIIMVGTCLPMMLTPYKVELFLRNMYTSISENFGWAYILSGMMVFGFLIWLAYSRFGKVKLGAAEDKVEFSDFSWAGMLFCTGVGAGMMYWAVIEWGHYYNTPPHGLEAGSIGAIEWASSMGLFHWGPIAWAIYCLPAITIAYPFYVKKVPYLRLSTSLYGILSERAIKGPIAKIVDILFIISLLGGAGYSLGVTTPMISAGFSHLFGLEDNFQLQVITALFCVTIFSISTYFGLSKGIKILSDWNIRLSLVLVGFILIAGPTVFILKTSISSLGFMISNFATMASWTDPFTDSKFVENWTVFYWAWWIAYAPFVGLFVTRISCGRTIRQLIFGMLFYGSGGGMLFFMVMGNYSLSVTLSETADIANIITTEGGITAIIQTLKTLPFPAFVIGIFCVVSIIFSATTYDSASYIIASTATEELEAGEDPERKHRLFWAFALAALPISLMFIGAMKVMQSVLLLVSFPILFIGILSAVALVKSLHRDFPEPTEKKLVIRSYQIKKEN